MDDFDSSLVSLAKSSSDSGIDGFSDTSSSSSTSDCHSDTCIFEEGTRSKQTKQSSQPHCCALNLYSISGRCIEILSPRTFLYLSNCVRVLDLSKNKIITLPETISELVNLHELDLSCNQLLSLPDTTHKLHKLQKLNVSDNKFTVPPPCLEFGLERITHLDLSRNFISKFPNAPKCTSLLLYLNLSNNCFNSLPLWLLHEECRSLDELDMSFNYCFDDPAFEKQLPLLKHHRTSALKSLKKLIIHNTGSNPVHLSLISSFESLQNVHMGNLPSKADAHNFYSDLEFTWFHNPNNIIELHLPYVGLALLPQDVERFSNLQVLDVSQNMLCWLPDKFVLLKSLKELIMSDCSLSYLPENFNQLKSLKKLVLNQNKLTDVRSCLSGLANLEYLDLYNNQLEELPVSLDCLPTIQMVDFDYNFVNLEEALDEKVNGEGLYDVYCRQQERLRITVSSKEKRSNGMKSVTNMASYSSLESLYGRRYSDTESSHSQFENTSYQCCNDGLDENWDEDSNSGSDYFEPNQVFGVSTGVYRYQLPLGLYHFGWTPPVKRLECQVPVNQQLSGFVFIPGQLHQKTTSLRKRRKLQDLPVAEGQFEDVCVDSFADLQEGETLGALLTKMHMFVRNAAGMRTRKRCKVHSVYEDCWHHGLWFRLSPPVSFQIPDTVDDEDI